MLADMHLHECIHSLDSFINLDQIISCEFNIDTACIEIKYSDSSIIFIDCTRVGYEVVRNMYKASELDWLVYNAPVDYMNLLFHGDIWEYTKNVTDYHPVQTSVEQVPIEDIKSKTEAGNRMASVFY